MIVGKNFGNWGHIEPFRDDIVTIGDNVVLGSGSIIITHCPISFYNRQTVDIKIGNNVYIGTRSLILPGVTIGDNVVIGAGSVVSKSIPSGVVAVGSPCIPIRHLSEAEIGRVRKLSEQGLVADGIEPA